MATLILKTKLGYFFLYNPEEMNVDEICEVPTDYARISYVKLTFCFA